MEHDLQREKVEMEVREALASKSDEQLLIDIHDESANARRDHVPTTRTLARFASLLVILSRRAEASSQKLERYTRTLVFLTWAVTLLALTTLGAVILQLYFMINPPK